MTAELTRRKFLGGAGLVSATALLSTLPSVACADEASSGDYGPWDMEADVVVIGFGAAGAAAAIESGRAGNSCIILEKQPEDGHWCNTRLSGGLVLTANDKDKAGEHLHELAGEFIPEEMSKKWAEYAFTLKDWFREIGFEDEFLGEEAVSEHDVAYPDSVTTTMLFPNNNGHAFFDFLAETALGFEGTQVVWDSPAFELITRYVSNDSNKQEVLGVKAKQGDKTVRIKANKGVVLSCGGYEYNRSLQQDYLAQPMGFYGNPGNTGDGILMATRAGAALWGMSRFAGAGALVADGIGFPPGFYGAGFFIVDETGKRFYNESNGGHAGSYYFFGFDPEERRYSHAPAYVIFDEVRAQSGPAIGLYTGLGREGYYDWSEDNSKEVEAGWIWKADTLEELAEQIGVDPDGLVETMAEWDESCEAGEDKFERNPEHFIPFTPPYYAAQYCPGGTNTSGGPRRNSNAEIVDYEGEPIPRLYGAGELGQAIGMLYAVAGASISNALCSGRIAGEQLATLDSWV